MPQKIKLADGTIGQRFTAEFERNDANPCTFPTRIIVSYYQQHPLLTLGDRVVMHVTLRALSSQSNLGQLPDQAVNAARKLHARGSAHTVNIVAHAPVYSIASVRNRLNAHLQNLPAPSRIKALMQALLLGVGHEILRDDWQSFKILGLAHVMVISGLHIGLVFIIARAMCGLVLRASSLSSMTVIRSSIVLAMLAAAGYAAIAGMSVPALRALCMVFMTQVPTLLGWRSRPVWILAISLVVLLLVNPFSALSSSLWLTIGATYAVLALSEALAGQAWWLRIVGLQILMTVLMAPLTAFWFGAVSIWGLVGNTTVTPLVTVVAIPLLLAGAVQDLLIPTAANDFWALCAIVLRITLAMVEGMANTLPSDGFFSVALSPHQFFGFTLLAVLWVWRRQWLWGFGATVGIFGIVWFLTIEPSKQARLQILDVGQGTAIVFSEGAAHLLYDTGAPYGPVDTQASRVILPVLRLQGVDALEHLVVSHRDTDHSGGLLPVLAGLQIQTHWGFAGHACRPGQRLPWPGDATIDVMSGSGWGEFDSNAASCVLRIRYREQTVLLAGDIPAVTEREMVRYWRDSLQADVLVVAHHGSKTSSAWSWLKWVNPRLAIISAGLDNRFGHPHSEVMNRLLRSGARVLNTGIDGGLEVVFDVRGGRQVAKSRGPMTPFWAQLSQLGASASEGIMKADREETP